MSKFWEFEPDIQSKLMEEVVAPQIGGYGMSQTEKNVSGFSSDIYVLHNPNAIPSSLVIKTPKSAHCMDDNERDKRVDIFEREIALTTKFCDVAWAQDYKRVKYFYEWPFAIARLRQGTLLSIIEDSYSWNIEEKLIAAIQIARGLHQCYERGLVAHQDLKPANIFFDDIRRMTSNSLPVRVYIADFGAANGVTQNPPRNFGSRPYMAPEQYKTEAIALPKAIDVFAFAVIVFEMLTDGYHPSGVRTADVWPCSNGKYSKENYWKGWSRKCSSKCNSEHIGNIPSSIMSIIELSLSTDPAERPPIEEFELALWDYLKTHTDTANNLECLIDAYEGMYFGNTLNEYMREHVARYNIE